MSYTVSFHLVNIDQLRTLLGSGNLSLLDDIGEIKREERNSAETLLLGTELDQENSHEYIYVFEKIVLHLFGKSENVPEFEDLHFCEFEGPLDWIVNSGSVEGLPDMNDFPIIGHRYHGDIKKFLDDWNDEKLNDFEPEVQEMIEAMFDVFKNAVEKEKDIITFYY